MRRGIARAALALGLFLACSERTADAVCYVVVSPLDRAIEPAGGLLDVGNPGRAAALPAVRRLERHHVLAFRDLRRAEQRQL